MTHRLLARLLRRFPPLAMLAISVPAHGLAQGSQGADFFEKQVRPLLAENCYACHSSSSQPVMGELKLDSEASFRRGGSRGELIAPGNLEKSLLITAISHRDERLRMPPTGRLPDRDIATLTTWVKLGAPWGALVESSERGENASWDGSLWAFQAPQDPPIPEVKDGQWVKSPLDAFILAELEAKGLRPAPPAGKRTLIRRATFDLIGLPPAPEEIQAFLADDSPGAFAHLVERLLTSPRYGERWGRHWLDVARYADSNGLDENLVFKNAYRYRDYVIDAFNDDKPFDRFIHEQLAGDLLDGPRDEATVYERQIATGFLSLGGKMLAEDDPVKMEMDIIDEQIDTVGRAFMGLTLGCARCHDHKFDPITAADYYSLAGIFKSSKTMENFKVVAKWHEYVLAPEEDRKRLEAHEQKIKAKQKQIRGLSRPADRRIADEARGKAGAYLLTSTELLKQQAIGLRSVVEDSGAANGPDVVAKKGTDFSRGNADPGFKKDPDDPRVLVGTDQAPYFVEYDIALPRDGHHQLELRDASAQSHTLDVVINGELVRAGAPAERNRVSSPDPNQWTVIGIFRFQQGKNTIRLEVDERFPYFAELAVAPHRLPDGAGIPRNRTRLAAERGLNRDILLRWAERLRASKGAPASVLYSWHAFGTPDYDSLSEWVSPVAALFEGVRPSTREELATFYHELFERAGRAWKTLHPEALLDDDPEDEDEETKKGEKDEEAKLADPALEALRQLLYEKYGPFRVPGNSERYYAPETRAEIERLKEELEALKEATPEFPRAMGVTEGEIGDLAVHLRGSHLSLGEVVPRQFPRVLASASHKPIGDKHSGRLELARWLTRDGHPLTSRVMVNRIWRWHFGRGIVPSTDNFGRLGQRPANQALLDWLARRFIEEKWSIKAMHRLIMLSSSYQMSTAFDEKAAQLDPENKLLWRMNRRRLEAEAIRDAIMTVGEGLDLTKGGSMLPLKDREYVTTSRNRDPTDYDVTRRAVYLPVVRSALYDVFQAFDFSDPSVPNGNRQPTVVSPQALFMMNGSIVLTQTRNMAARLLGQIQLDDSGRIRQAYETTLGRLPTATEIDWALSFIARVGAQLNNHEPDAGKLRLRSWQLLCQTLVASNEFLYLE